ncbi:MAG: EAL domain-containing protein [Clostridia bacterium]|nr:EAL domain-containing protein [Clostridia bacterium]
MLSNINRVAMALLIDYTSVYYIDPKTGYYECYSTNQGYQKLELQSSGKDFFTDAQRDIASVIYEEDKAAVSVAMTKDSLLKQFKDKDEVSIVYRLLIDGNPVYHTMRIFRDASDGEECLILGVLNVDETVRTGQRTKTYNAIAKTLANRYATIYYVDLTTNHYVEYSASNDYRELEVPTEGYDFFAETYKNVQRVIHPDDLALVEKISDKDYMLSVTQNGRRFRMEYRLIMSDGAHYVRLVAVCSESNYLIIALENIDDEMRNQEEMKAISEKNLVFSQIAESLAKRYGMIYYIDTETDNYIEFTATQAYKEFNINPSGSDFFGTSQRNVSAIIYPTDRERVFAALDKKAMLKAMKENGSFTMTYRLLLGSGSSYTRMSVFWANDDRHLIMGVMNIDNEMEKELALQKTLEENATFFQIASSLANQYDTIYYVDMLNDHYIEFSSTNVYKSLEVQPSGDDFFRESLVNINRVIHPDDRDAFQSILNKSTMIQKLQEKNMLTHTYRILIGEGFMYARLSIIWATDNKHLIIGVMNIDREIRREQEIAKKLSIANEKAYRDELTGVKNKTAFAEYEQDLQEQIKKGKAEPFAVVICDVNGLKKINDTYGHQAGDEYIIKASKMICDIFQHSPVFRTGGDEFAIILKERDYVIRKELVLALHDRSVEHISTEDVVISGGLSDYRPGEDTSFQAVFERADALMYEEKLLLKGMGSITRDESEETVKQLFTVDDNSDILHLKRKILIVEDELVNQMLLGNMLGDGFERLYASDGIEALEQIKTHKDELALVLLDLQMPRMSGMEVLKVMKGEKELEDIPVIVLTSEQSAEVECLKIGAIDFIPKPYPSWEIIQVRVNRCIELSEKRTIIHSTERDSLTNLFNIDYFLRYVRMYDQHYTDMAMDAIVLDINHFHVLNERYGKQYGDSILARIGTRVRQIAREVGGVGCRRGADTFLIYCPSREEYDSILFKVSDGLAGEDDSGNRVRLRMGVYTKVDKTLEIERRFDYAKIAANSVKTGYLKSIGIYDMKMHEAELHKARLLEDFRPSLEKQEFTVYYQPKFNVRPDVPVLSSAEALVRWNHPELGLISPGVFIPLLEDNGLILELDKFVWRSTAAMIRSWKDRFNYSVPVSVNVSRIDMLTPNLKDIFKGIMDEFRISVDDLILEITESAYTGDSDQVIAVAKELRDMGFRIEMDDFGTGYSSLGMLSHLPIDVLKLDMSFVRTAFGEKRDVRLIEMIIDIADYLHVPIVAEGVETEEQCMVLKAMGCDLVQGYYFSKPVPPASFDHFLTEKAALKTEILPEAEKTSPSISQALTENFENIFYINMLTGDCLEFCLNNNGELNICHSEMDFFIDGCKNLIKDVCPEDMEKIRDATSRTSLMQAIEQKEDKQLSFCKLRNETRVPYILQTMRSRENDEQHIIICIKHES